MNLPQPSAYSSVPVEGVSSRARQVQVALGVTAALHVWNIAARAWSIAAVGSFHRGDGATQDTLRQADLLVNVGVVGSVVMLIVTAVLFSMWVHGLVATTRALGSERLRWQPGEAVWSFFIPLLNLWRPYQVLRDVHDVLEPDAVPAPVPRMVVGEHDGYRGVTAIDAPPPPTLPPSLIGLWWGTFMLSKVIGRFATKSPTATSEQLVSTYQYVMVSSLVSMAAAVLAAVVVRGLTARLVERQRRLAAMPTG